MALFAHKEHNLGFPDFPVTFSIFYQDFVFASGCEALHIIYIYGIKLEHHIFNSIPAACFIHNW